MHKAADVLGLVAAHFAIIEPRLGALGSFGPTRRQAPPLLKTMCLEEAAQCPVKRNRPQLRRLVGERNQIVVMELGGPRLMGRVLGKQSLAHRVGHRRLLTQVRAHLAL
jgi:hypothetical protein